VLVWDDHLCALTVAKVLRAELRADERALKELRVEAEVLERLAHPVIVRVFDAALEGPYPHLLIEHLEGPTLRRLIRRGGPVPMEQLLPVAAHLAAALAYMERMEIVHLDVKPDNVIMGVPPRLIDLSVARPLERAARIRGPVGTDAYMAPEQCAPEDHAGLIGSATDVWGLGATLHHAVSGAVPFPRRRGAGESSERHVRFPQLGQAARPLPTSVEPRLRNLVARCLEPRPADRITALELLEGLEPLVAELPRKLVLGRRGAWAR
jgi:serine/threonine protein kinase